MTGAILTMVVYNNAYTLFSQQSDGGDSGPRDVAAGTATAAIAACRWQMFAGTPTSPITGDPERFTPYDHSFHCSDLCNVIQTNIGVQHTHL